MREPPCATAFCAQLITNSGRWVQPGHVRNLSFATVGLVDEEVFLHASDLGAPPAGRHSAVEIRIADGSNYYFEYRREQPNTLKDQDVPADRTVVGSHCISGTEPPDRRNILRLRDDSDADKSEFQVNDDYEEQNTSSAAYPNDFTMTVLEIAAKFARVHILYGDAKPDPQSRPWAPSTYWKRQPWGDPTASRPARSPRWYSLNVAMSLRLIAAITVSSLA